MRVATLRLPASCSCPALDHRPKFEPAAKLGLLRPAALLRLFVVELQEVEEFTDLMIELGRMPHSQASV